MTNELLDSFYQERIQLAKLAADTPQFFNPLEVMAAKKLRDELLSRLPGGSKK